ncbi:type II toxin-antitoxin system VapC family toxin [Pontibacter russatus]|uniref:type II toxin-antitoxin system VapC family toxin n=1 Tax=Pontibacter russatus TaxID=2694929 RepID=UPI00137A6628|nr:PIN domain-containing protein [Pontibacter russatus]
MKTKGNGIEKTKVPNHFSGYCPLIYFIEGNTAYQAGLKNFFAAFDKGDFAIITSTLTLLEVLVQPMKLNRQDLVEQYKRILSSASGIEILEITSAVACRAAELRAKYKLKTPDSIQVGTALEYEAKYFLTNDVRLSIIKEIKTITPQEL